MSERAVLITGADGYLGSRIAARFLAETRHRLILWVRARDAEERAGKLQRLVACLGAPHERWSMGAGDLRAEEPFRDVEPGEIAAVVHAAALIRFDAERAAAEAVNVAGTRRVLAFARRCRGLESLGLLSSIYATGLRAGTVREEPGDSDAFANEYERSKWLAEQLSLDAGVPCHVLRVATVLADSDDGVVGQYNFAHRTLELLFRGLMPVFPGCAETFAYFVTGDFVSRMVVALAAPEAAARPGVWHLCPERDAALTLDTLLDTAWTAFERDPGFRRRRTLRPRFLDAAGFETLSEAMARFSPGVAGDAFRALRPFARQLYVTKDVRHDRLAAAVGSRLTFPDPRVLVTRVCDAIVGGRLSAITHRATGPGRASPA